MASIIHKIAVVTGAGSGIGKATCLNLLSRGARVIGVDAKAQAMDDIPLEDGDKYTVDVSVKTQTEDLYSSIIKRHGTAPQILVNSAGITRDNLLVKITEDDWDKVLDVNLKGTFLMTQCHTQSLIKSLKSSGEQEMSGLAGSIVNIASASAKGNLGQANYSASKAGVIGLTKTCAQELARFGVRVNCILPGFVDTPMIQTVPEEILAKYLKFVPLKRAGNPEEVAKLITFLASDDSSYMTGTAIDIDGGMRM